MHGMGWSSADDGIDRVSFEVFLQESYRRPYPPAACIGDEKIASDPYGKLLFPSLILFFINE
jgi:hypothetical protein